MSNTSNTIESNKIESALMMGDFSTLSPDERLSYYRNVCDSLGVNPLTQPFQYMALNGKLILYATRACAEQLRKINKISIKIVGKERIGDVYIVTARAVDKDGREDESTGAVFLGNARGEALANLLMKAETKAKRRVTLSISGLGFLDETEVDTIPGALKVSFSDDKTTTSMAALTASALTASATVEKLEKANQNSVALTVEAFKKFNISGEELEIYIGKPMLEWNKNDLEEVLNQGKRFKDGVNDKAGFLEHIKNRDTENRGTEKDDLSKDPVIESLMDDIQRF